MAEPTGVDVGDEISLRVGVPGSRAIGHVRRQTLRRRKAGPLADEQHYDARLQELADVIHDANAAVPHGERHARAPAVFRGSGEQPRQKLWHLHPDRTGRESVADDNLQFHALRICRIEYLASIIIEASAKI